MRITPIEHGITLAQSFSGQERGEGVHMSDLYNALYAELEPKRFGFKGPLPLEKFELGMAWEEMLEEGLKRRIILAEEVERPGEFHIDVGKTRIFYNPDLLIFNGLTRTGEIKLSFMSVKGLPWKLGETFTSFDPKINKWITQIKLYCKALGTRYARLYGFFPRDMCYGKNAQLLAWDLDFSQRELDDEWSWVMGFSKQRGLIR